MAAPNAAPSQGRRCIMRTHIGDRAIAEADIHSPRVAEGYLNEPLRHNACRDCYRLHMDLWAEVVEPQACKICHTEHGQCRNCYSNPCEEWHKARCRQNTFV